MKDITHQDLLASLDRSTKIQLLERSDVLGLKRAVIHLGLIALVSIYIYYGLPWWELVLLPQGILLIFLFTALHETIHKTAFKSPWLNTLMADLSGFIILLPARWFREFHFAHHRHTNISDLDPELAIPKPKTLLQYLLMLSGLPVWFFHMKVMIENALEIREDGFVARNLRKPIYQESRFYLLAYALIFSISIYYQTGVLLWLWVLPILLGQPFLRAYLLAEHTLCPEVENMLKNTRTTLTTGMVRFITWNMPYHTEHHCLPSVPFHQLPRFHQLIKDHLCEIEKGYSTFHRKLARTFE